MENIFQYLYEFDSNTIVEASEKPVQFLSKRIPKMQRIPHTSFALNYIRIESLTCEFYGPFQRHQAINILLLKFEFKRDLEMFMVLPQKSTFGSSDLVQLSIETSSNFNTEYKFFGYQFEIDSKMRYLNLFCLCTNFFQHFNSSQKSAFDI